MGLYLNQKDDKYTIMDSVSGKRIHDEKWISLDEAKKVMIERKFIQFLEYMIEIDMEFPHRYQINGKPYFSKPGESFFRWIMDKSLDDDRFNAKVKEVIEKLKLNLTI